MANITIVENQSGSYPNMRESNENLMWVKQYFELQNYVRIRQNSPFLIFGCYIQYSTHQICDLFLIAFARTAADAEDLIPQLDAEVERLRQTLLRGRAVFEGTIIQKHHFMTLHKPYVRFSYLKEGQPVGFAIRPLILVRSGHLWEYFTGATTRIDVLSFDKDQLNNYLARHRETLELRNGMLVNRSKYRYWKLSNALLDYTHLPLIALWVLYFFCTVLQLSVPFTMEALLTLTIGLYIGFISFSYAAYRIFQRYRIRELRELDFHRGGATQSYCPKEFEIIEEVMNESLEVGAIKSDLETKSREPSQNAAFTIQPPRLNSEKYYLQKIESEITAIMCIHDSNQLQKRGFSLFRKVFSWFLGGSYNALPIDECLSMDLRKAAEKNPDLFQLKELHFWVKKIDTQTPFTAEEIQSFKKFLLHFLYGYKLLPPELARTVELAQQKRHQTMQRPQECRGERSETNPSQRLNIELDQLNSLVSDKELCIPNPAKESEKEPVLASGSYSNLEVASLPGKEERGGLSPKFIQTVRGDERNGIYCWLITDQNTENKQEIIIQFESWTKDLEVSSRDCVDIRNISDPKLRNKLETTKLPAVLIGLGKQEEIIPCGLEGSEQRIFTIVEDLLKRPSGTITFREKSIPEQEDISRLKVEMDKDQQTDSIEHKEFNSELQILSNIEEIRKRSILIDGNNLIFLVSDYLKDSIPRLSCIFDVLKELKVGGFTKDQILVIFDANIFHILKNHEEKRQIRSHEKQELFRIAPSGMSADTYLIQVAGKLGRKFVVFSNDTYREKPKWFRRHRIGVVYDPDYGMCMGVDTLEDLLGIYNHGRKENGN